MDLYVNFWAVLVSAVASMIIGSLWYGPIFGKMFMSAMGMDSWSQEKRDAMKKSMVWSYVLQFLASLLTFYVLARFISMSDMTVGGGLTLAFWVWIGFAVPWKLGETIWGGKWSIFWLGVFNSLVTLLVAGAIIGAWH